MAASESASLHVPVPGRSEESESPDSCNAFHPFMKTCDQTQDISPDVGAPEGFARDPGS